MFYCPAAGYSMGLPKGKSLFRTRICQKFQHPLKELGFQVLVNPILRQTNENWF